MPTTTAKVFDIEDDDDLEAGPLTEFTVVFRRYGDPERYTFSARPQLRYKAITGAAKATAKGRSADARTLLLFERLIRPSLLDDDGVPAKWEPEIEDGEFVNPDGDLVPRADLDKYTALEAGSSRRRWVALMDTDDELDVSLKQIGAVYEHLIEVAADRPTRRSSR